MITVTHMHTSNTIFRSPVFILRSERTNGANRTNDRPADRQAMPNSGLRRKEYVKIFRRLLRRQFCARIANPSLLSFSPPNRVAEPLACSGDMESQSLIFV